MRKGRKQKSGDLRPEYDFSSLAGGIRGKYHRRYRAGVNLALLEPEVAQAFPTDAAVNEALRTVLRTSRALRRATRLPNDQTKLTPGEGRSPGKQRAVARRRSSRRY
jgi:hypothetical protein